MPRDEQDFRARLLPLERALRRCQSLTLFLCGNPARGDDGIGTELEKRLKRNLNHLNKKEIVKVIYDMQWQIEDSLEFRAKGLALFVDCSVSALPPFELGRVTRGQHGSGSHSLSPSELLGVAELTGIAQPQEAWQLALPGHNFELGHSVNPELKQSARILTDALAAVIDEWSAPKSHGGGRS